MSATAHLAANSYHIAKAWARPPPVEGANLFAMRPFPGRDDPASYYSRAGVVKNGRMVDASASPSTADRRPLLTTEEKTDSSSTRVMPLTLPDGKKRIDEVVRRARSSRLDFFAIKTFLSVEKDIFKALNCFLEADNTTRSSALSLLLACLRKVLLIERNPAN